MSLGEVRENRDAIITAIDGDTRFMSRITSIGLTPGCSGCSSGNHSDGHTCKGCLPQDGFQNMGQMWEVVK